MAKKKKDIPFVPEKATDAQINAFERNYAEDILVCQRFMAAVKGDISNARNNRLQLEDKWIDDIRLWSCVLDDLGYQGRSNVFVPELHNQIEQGVEKDITSMFPSPELVKAIAMNGTPQSRADKIQAAVEYELNEKAKLFIKHVEFERQKRLLGTSIYKGRFRKEMRDVFWRDEDGKPLRQQIPKYHGVDWDVVDMFRFYIYPEFSNLENCKMVFEDALVQLGDLKRSGLYVNLDSVGTSTIDKNHQWSDCEQLNIVDLASAIAGRIDSVCTTEIWCDFDIKEGDFVPVVGTIANDGTLIRLTRNPYWFQRHPYLGEVYAKRPGKIFYGLSMADKLRSQNYQINDLTNHTMDSINYILNPITIVDPALAGDVNSLKVMPGAKWLGSPDGIKPYAFPDISGSGLRAIQEIRGQVAQFSDNSPGVAPQLEGKSRSATQSSIVAAAVSSRSRMSAKSEEYSVLTPMCVMTHSFLVQYMDHEWQIKYQGPEAGAWITDLVRPNDIIGEVDWVWKGPSAQEKTAVRSQQLLAFFKEAIQIQALQPGEIDLPMLFKRIAREAFDIRDIDEVFKSLREKKTIDAEVENIGLYDAEDVPVHNGDIDDAHIEIHMEVVNDRKADKDAKLAAIAHIQKHEDQKQAKAQVAQLKARLEAQKSQLSEGSSGLQGLGAPEGPQAGPNGVVAGRPQPPPNPFEGNNSQTASGAGLLTGVRGVNPS